MPLFGSPPRGRGKAWLVPLPLWRDRITPAWAGKRRSGSAESHAPQDHPRVGGEKDLPHQVIVSVLGSPPRGRGKGLPASTDLVQTRITPAWAGKSQSGLGVRCAPEDHPRVGGEKFSRLFQTLLSLGSPPRGRGKVVHHRIGHNAVGITPAWAGKRYMYTLGLIHQGDHPRVGGEK